MGSEFWTAVAAALVTLAGSWGLAYYKIRKAGIDASNAAEITDRAKFREHTLEALAKSQQHYEDCLAREASHIQTIAELEARVAALEKRETL